MGRVPSQRTQRTWFRAAATAWSAFGCSRCEAKAQTAGTLPQKPSAGARAEEQVGQRCQGCAAGPAPRGLVRQWGWGQPRAGGPPSGTGDGVCSPLGQDPHQGSAAARPRARGGGLGGGLGPAAAVALCGIPTTATGAGATFTPDHSLQDVRDPPLLPASGLAGGGWGLAGLQAPAAAL